MISSRVLLLRAVLYLGQLLFESDEEKFSFRIDESRLAVTKN